MDLNRIPKPAKNHKKCSLKMLRTDGKVPTLNLFKNKRCKGWWPVAAREKDEETGEEHLILKVRCCCCCLVLHLSKKEVAVLSIQVPEGAEIETLKGGGGANRKGYPSPQSTRESGGAS